MDATTADANTATTTIAALTGLVNLVKKIVETVKNARDLKPDDPAHIQALQEIQDASSSLLARLFAAQEEKLGSQAERTRLMEENAQLREQIRAHNVWATEREKYELKKERTAWCRLPRNSVAAFPG
jgi:hypothetical protein